MGYDDDSSCHKYHNFYYYYYHHHVMLILILLMFNNLSVLTILLYSISHASLIEHIYTLSTTIVSPS